MVIISITKLHNIMKLDKNGSIHLIIGPMFAGKSSHLIKTISSFRAIKIPLFIVKHSLDIRYNSEKIASHNQVLEDCNVVNKLIPLLENEDYKSSKVIIIDEAQFFKDLVIFVKYACDIDKKNIIVYGLNADYNRHPFQNIAEVQALSDDVKILKAYCCYCMDSTIANFSLRLDSSKEQIMVGTDDVYKPVCRKHYLEYNVFF